MQAEARLLVVGIMGKILAGDTRGISAVLLERVQQTMTQVSIIPDILQELQKYRSAIALLRVAWSNSLIEVAGVPTSIV